MVITQERDALSCVVVFMRAPLVPITIAFLVGVWCGTVAPCPPMCLAALGAAGAGIAVRRWRPFDSAQGAVPSEVEGRRDGVLLRRYRDGEARYPGTLEDYAFLSYGLLELYEAGFEPRDLAEAKALAAQMVERFWDDTHGGFFLRSREEPALIVRAKDVRDSATPSGNSLAALVLLRLGRLTGEERLEALGRRTLDASAAAATQEPFGYPQLLIAWDFALGPTKEIVIAGDPTAPQTAALTRAVHERFLPRAVTLLHSPGASGAVLEAVAPFVKTQEPLQGQPTAYVCEHFVCRLPVTTVEELNRLLDDTQGPVHES